MQLCFKCQTAWVAFSEILKTLAPYGFDHPRGLTLPNRVGLLPNRVISAKPRVCSQANTAQSKMGGCFAAL